jgi:hypothetical protein
MLASPITPEKERRMKSEDEVHQGDEELAASEPQPQLVEQALPPAENEQWWRNDGGSGEVQ